MFSSPIEKHGSVLSSPNEAGMNGIKVGQLESNPNPILQSPSSLFKNEYLNYIKELLLNLSLKPFSGHMLQPS